MYDPELLRTFLAVTQSLSFTRAAEALGIRQPTVSQHVRRLEEAVGRPLLVRDTRSVALTSDGEAMAGFAREILAAQERAVGYFTGSQLAGRLRFGVTDDLALTPLPKILRDFRQLYPRIDLELTVLQNEALLRRVESGHLDVAFVKRGANSPSPSRGQLVRRDQLVWVAVEGTRFEPDQQVPLVVYQAPSLSRAISVQALERVGRRSRITCTVKGVNGVLAAVRAGLGVAVMARTLMPADLVELPASAGLPKLPHLDLVLLTNRNAPAEPAKALTSAILASGAPLKPVQGTP
ncbi:LysR substrate-binding domain-containing protein [Phycicoccus sp. SLBN-51]|uniref:LysR substrate-binding domain-containing protein n=1 Tax=Phycicoccus sp. SLBN-51 TaxID=2768447 RepID=UPI0011525D28|nr:LysR substrate-binding domain-containing protein [Phycicoccus sp. SLBN-51]TQJ50217.1 LysR family transcriptional regulator [Phycicoccus sp. SLBN-51]